MQDKQAVRKDIVKKIINIGEKNVLKKKLIQDAEDSKDKIQKQEEEEHEKLKIFLLDVIGEDMKTLLSQLSEEQSIEISKKIANEVSSSSSSQAGKQIQTSLNDYFKKKLTPLPFKNLELFESQYKETKDQEKNIENIQPNEKILYTGRKHDKTLKKLINEGDIKKIQKFGTKQNKKNSSYEIYVNDFFERHPDYLLKYKKLTNKDVPSSSTEIVPMSLQTTANMESFINNLRDDGGISNTITEDFLNNTLNNMFLKGKITEDKYNELIDKIKKKSSKIKKEKYVYRKIKNNFLKPPRRIFI